MTDAARWIDAVDLNAGQAAALDEVVDWAEDDRRLLSLSGPAGSGKTTLLKIFAEQLGPRATWSAMTGRAARRMREAAGVKAKTTHAALYHAPLEIDNKRAKRIELQFNDVRREVGDVLVIDEASMIDPKILGDILASPYRKILLVGDGYQIPPVSDADDWSVFREIPGPRLTEVMRTSGAIVEVATRVRERQEIVRGVCEGGGSRYDGSSDFRSALRDWFDDREDHVLVTWTNAARTRLNHQIRHALGHASTLPEPGEPVVVRKNDHKQRILNGDVLYVDDWLGDGPEVAGVKTRYVRLRSTAHPALPGLFDDEPSEGEDRKVTVLTVLQGKDSPFDGFLPYVGLAAWKMGLEASGIADPPGPIPISYAYCLTGHLVQGSEYRRATTLLFNDLANRHFRKTTTLPDGSQMSFAMRFIYTAVTRAKERSTLVVSG